MQQITNQLKAQFCEIIGSQSVIDDQDLMRPYSVDWSNVAEPAASVVLLPSSTEQVAQIVTLCAQHDVAIVPSGGRTGLSGGAIAANGEVVIALDRINDIADVDVDARTVTCGAGAITASIQQAASDAGLMYPVDFASSGSSQIGGNLSTNAGGIKVIRYGMTREWVLGLTVVTGTGEVLHLNNGLLKNNTGYDLRHLYIGAEGTLGLITEVTLKLTSPPSQSTVTLLALDSITDLINVLRVFQQTLKVNAFEFFGDNALQRVLAHSQLVAPFGERANWYALIETECADSDERLIGAFEQCFESGWVQDGVISQSQTQAKQLWRLREDISETISVETPYKNDLSVKVPQVPAFLADIEALVAKEYPEFEIVWFGHIGDGNLHLNILKPASWQKDEFFKVCAAASRKTFEIVQSYGGSVSAEHGVGLLKRDYLGYSRSEQEIALMTAIKRAFDPHGIMNPNKLLKGA